jgi:hypothetical protein
MAAALKISPLYSDLRSWISTLNSSRFKKIIVSRKGKRAFERVVYLIFSEHSMKLETRNIPRMNVCEYAIKKKRRHYDSATLFVVDW